MNTDAKAAVSGASGFIGSAVVRKLLEQGRQVRALCEPGANLRNLEDLRDNRALECITVDVCDREGMCRALDGTGAFYHLAAIYKIWMKNPAPIYRVNIEGTTVSLLAARDAGVSRIVYTSSIAAVGLREDERPSDESVEFNLYDIANDYILTKYLSERIALRFAESGLPVVVVNPAFPFGPRDTAPTPTGNFVLGLLRGQVPAVGKGGFCAIDVDDVALGHIAAETKGRIGERYILGAHNTSFYDFCKLVARIAGVKAPRLQVPRKVGEGIAVGMQFWAERITKTEPIATLKSIRYLMKNAYFDSSKAQRELGLPTRPLEESIERSVRFFRDTAMV